MKSDKIKITGLEDFRFQFQYKKNTLTDAVIGTISEHPFPTKNQVFASNLWYHFDGHNFITSESYSPSITILSPSQMHEIFVEGNWEHYNNHVVHKPEDNQEYEGRFIEDGKFTDWEKFIFKFILENKKDKSIRFVGHSHDGTKSIVMNEIRQVQLPTLEDDLITWFYESIDNKTFGNKDFVEKAVNKALPIIERHTKLKRPTHEEMYEKLGILTREEGARDKSLERLWDYFHSKEYQDGK